MSALSSIRQRLDHAGSDERQLEILRHMLASSKDLKVLRALGVALEEFRDYASEELLGAVADVKDRLREKMERIDAASLPPSPKPRRPCASRNIRTTVAPQVRMIISPWVQEADGVLSRLIYADPKQEWHP